MDAVEEVKARISIEDVISEYVQLKRAGRNFKGLSPFTNEKTPSFVVSPEKQIWHDFSSGKGGNMFSFIMEMEGLDFKGALEHLARKAGIDLSQYRTGHGAETSKLKERLYQVVEMAAKFYQVQFSQSQKALEYVFKQRKFDKQTALDFRLGYSPNTGDALITFLKKQNVTDKEMQQAGLTSRYGDMFRGRLMVPLMDPQGRVIGFTARLLDDQPNAPKYINTPQTLLYDKSRHVFGLHLAKEAIRQAKYAVVAEGNLDVISSHQAGIKQVVATAGTAVTEMHLKALNRFTPDIRLAFDQDRAGQAATERAIPIASKVGVALSMVNIPEGKDPDELIKKDPALWEAAISEPQYALDWLIKRYQAQLDLETAAGKRQFSDVVLDVIRKLPDQVEQDHYVQKIAEIIGVSKEALISKLSGESSRSEPLKKGKVRPVNTKDVQVERTKAQNQLLSLALMRPSLREYTKELQPEMLVVEPARELLKFLQVHPDFKGDARQLQTLVSAGNSTPAEEMQNLGDYVKMLVLQYEATYQDIDELELGYEAERLQIRLIEQYVKSKKAEIIAKMQNADEATTQSLLGEAKSLDELLSHKESAHGKK